MKKIKQFREQLLLQTNNWLNTKEQNTHNIE